VVTDAMLLVIDTDSTKKQKKVTMMCDSVTFFSNYTC
jgi:hypothetical protein